MSEEMIVRHCSPTLAGLKTANMFNCPYSSARELMDSIRSVNSALGPKGVRMLPLRIREGAALIYVYRPARLQRDLSDPVSAAILSERGYPGAAAPGLIAELRSRLCKNDGFPHEIGLFLGYPPDDVNCFISDRGRACKCVGCWRAYNDPVGAEKTFALYKKCTRLYCRAHKAGRTLSKLTVSERVQAG